MFEANNEQFCDTFFLCVKKTLGELGNSGSSLEFQGAFFPIAKQKSMRIQFGFFLVGTHRAAAFFQQTSPAKQSNLLVSSMGNLKISEVCRGAKSTMP